jgi:hypothetical protein
MWRQGEMRLAPPSRHPQHALQRNASCKLPCAGSLLTLLFAALQETHTISEQHDRRPRSGSTPEKPETAMKEIKMPKPFSLVWLITGNIHVNTWASCGAWVQSRDGLVVSLICLSWML